MKRVLLLLPLILVACTTQPQWTVTDIHVQQDLPSALPPTAAGTVTLNLGENSASGFTGCAAFQATTTRTEDYLTIGDIEYSEDFECDGATEQVHDQLSDVLVPDASFHIFYPSEGEMVLRHDTDEIDPVSIRLAAL